MNRPATSAVQTELLAFAGRARKGVAQAAVCLVFTGLLASQAVADGGLKSKALQAVEQGRFSKAIRYLEHIPAKARSHADNRALAYSYFRARKLDRAKALAQTLVKQSPGDDEAAILLGDIHAAQDEWKKALPLYIKACQTKGAPPQRWLRVGQAWQAVGRPAMAELAFDQYQRLSGTR